MTKVYLTIQDGSCPLAMIKPHSQSCNSNSFFLFPDFLLMSCQSNRGNLWEERRGEERRRRDEECGEVGREGLPAHQITAYISATETPGIRLPLWALPVLHLVPGFCAQSNAKEVRTKVRTTITVTHRCHCRPHVHDLICSNWSHLSWHAPAEQLKAAKRNTIELERLTVVLRATSRK